MIIGIDIDDTVFDTHGKLFEAALEFDKLYLNGKGIRNKKKYKVNEAFRWKDDVKNRFYTWFAEQGFMFNLDLKPNANTIIKKLHEEGNKIVIITYRKGENVYEKTKKLLEKNKVYFDKLIVDSGPKGLVSRNERIDFFIDDSYSQCVDIKENGTPYVVMFGTEENKKKKFFKLNSWDEIYDYVWRVRDGE